jgi:hypothetical protein
MHEAWEIKRLINKLNTFSIVVSDSCATSNSCNWTLDKLTFYDGKADISEIGSYTLTNTHRYNVPDSIALIYKEDTLRIQVDSIIRIDNLPNKIAWTKTSRVKQFKYQGNISVSSAGGKLVIEEGYLPSIPINDLTDSYTISKAQYYIVKEPRVINLSIGSQQLSHVIPENNRLHLIKTDTTVTIFLKMDFNSEALIKKTYYDLMAYLTLHNSIRDTLDDVHDLAKTYYSYKSNPFLYNLLKPVLYDYNLTSQLSLMDFNSTEFNDAIQTNKTKNYSWVDEMYSLNAGNKILETEAKDKTYYLNLSPENNSSLKLLSSESSEANDNMSRDLSINQTNIIAGLSDFILARAKEELSITFLEKFKKNLESDSFPEYRTLFPVTTSLLLKFDISNYKNLLESGRQAFFRDISNLGVNLPKLITLPKYAKKTFSSELYNVALFFNLVNLVYEDKSIEEIMISTFRQLVIREDQLKEFINLEIASALSRGKAQVSSDNLSTQLSGFTLDLKSLYNTSLQSQKSLYNEIKGMEYDTISTPEITAQIYMALDSLSAIGKMARNFNFVVDNIKITAPDYIQNYTQNYIRGKGYYGAFFSANNYNISDYEKYFENELADSIYILKGLEQIDDITAAQYGNTFNTWINDLLQLSDKIKSIRSELEFKRIESLNNKMALVNNLNTILVSGLFSDMKVLTDEGLTQNTNFDLAALSYLYNILDDGEWAFIDQLGFSQTELLSKINARLTLLNTVVKQIELKKTGHSVQKVLSQNNYPREYASVLEKGTTIDSTVFTTINDIQNQLKNAAPTIAALNTKLNTLNATCNALEVYADASKIKSLKTARQLLGITELATQLLYSVQFSFDTQKTVVSFDTSSVQYSVSNLSDTSYTYNKTIIDTTSVGAIDNATNWMSKEDYLTLFDDKETRSIYLGLLLQQLGNMEYGSRISSDNLPLFTTKVLSNVLEINAQKNNLALKKIQGLEITFTDRYPFLKAVVDLIALTLETPIIANKSVLDKDSDLRSFLSIISGGLSLYDNLSNNEYTSAVSDALSIFKVIVKDKEVIGKKIKIKKENVKTERLLNTLMTYGSFMSEVIKAQSPDQVKAALYAFAAPAGSSAIKREYMYNFSLNSYLGVAGGLEYRKVNGNYNSAGTVSLSVPIGFCFSKKFINNKKGSWSLFAPILDIGAVTAFRFDNNDVSDLPDLNFQNLVSPGLYLFRNFPSSPFTLGAGWQYGPTVRNIANDMNEQSSTYRFLISLTIDVPLLNIASGDKAYDGKSNK